MKDFIKSRLIKELESKNIIICDNCGWKWDKDDSNIKDLYIYHKCGFNYQPITENLQQAEKLYFKNQATGEQMKQVVLSVTNGDVFTRLVADLVFHFASFSNNKIDDGIIRLAKMFHKYLKEYDNKVFPLLFSLEQYGRTEDNEHHIITLYELLNARNIAITKLRTLPSIGVRNLKTETQKKYTNSYALKMVADDLTRLSEIITQLIDIGTDKANQVIQKILSSKNDLKSMVEVGKFYQHSFTAGENIEKEEILYLIEENDCELIQDSNGVLVIKVNSYEAMQEISCTSLWCFSRPNSENFWNDYTNLGYVYVIYNFKEDVSNATFLLTYTDEEQLFVSTNVPIEAIIPDVNSDEYLIDIGVDISKLKYELENELSLAENSYIIKKILRESIDASEAYNDTDTINGIINGNRDLGITNHTSYNDLLDKFKDSDIKIAQVTPPNSEVRNLYVKHLMNGTATPASLANKYADNNIIVYRDNDNGKFRAKKLLSIMIDNDGFVSDKNKKTAMRIGSLLNYNKSSITDYVNRIYNK